MSGFAVVKKAPSDWKKKPEKNPFSLFVQIRFSKWCAEVFFKYMGLETLKGFRVLENCSLQQNY